MKYIQCIRKSTARFGLFSIGVIALSILQLWPSDAWAFFGKNKINAKALSALVASSAAPVQQSASPSKSSSSSGSVSTGGVSLGVAAAPPPVRVKGSDSSKVTAATNKTPKKYFCNGAMTVDTTNVTQVPVPCGSPYDQKNYACPAGQVMVSKGSADKGYATYQYTNCQSAYSSCAGSTYQSRTTFISPPARQGMMSCPSEVPCSSGCAWTRVWTANPVCYIGCAPQTLSSSSCQWQ